MARKKTKKQKIKTEKKLSSATKVEVSNSGQISINLDNVKKAKIKSTTFSQSQVSLLHKDLIKTLTTTLIVFSILIFIYLKS